MKHLDIIAATYATHTSKEQAALIGRSIQRVYQIRSEAVCAGLVKPCDRATYAEWSDADFDRFTGLYRKLLDPERAAKMIGRTYDSARHETYKRGETLETLLAGHAWTRVELAALLSVDKSTIVRWERDGYIKTFRRGRYRHGQLWVRRSELLRFFGVREVWPAYNPDCIKNAELAAAARFERLQARGRWVRVPEYARIVHFSASTVLEWIRLGRFDKPLTRVNNAYWIWVEA